MKRSRAVALTAASMTAVLAGCSDNSIETHTYATVDACTAAGVYSKESCLAAFRTARDQNSAVAPKYDDKAQCEAEHGAANCQQTGMRTSSGRSVFIPMMLGYMMGQNANNGRSVPAQPLYQSRGGAYFTAGGHEVTRQLGTAAKVDPTRVSAPARSMTIARGGFGASRMSFSS